MTSRDNPKLREIVERLISKPDPSYSVDTSNYEMAKWIVDAARGAAYAVLDEVLGPLRQWGDRMGTSVLSSAHSPCKAWRRNNFDLSRCSCGLRDLEALCRELLK